MPYRREVHRTLEYGKLPAFLELQRAKNKLIAEAGGTPYSVWCPAFGELHHLVLEATFASLAAYEAESAVIARVEEIAGLDAEQIGLVRPGTASDRLSKVLVSGDEL
jgi:hypothetical protein